MDKPVSLSVKAWIIRNMSVKTMIQESVIETVVNHQFESALVAIDQHNSLEFSGFGKFFFNIPKALKKLERLKTQMIEFQYILDNDENTIIKKRNAALKLQSTIKSFEYLNKKLNGLTPIVRGMEKQTVSLEGTKGTDSESERAENAPL